MAEDTGGPMTCPRCGPERPLAQVPGPLRALRCGACGGALVPFATSAAVRVQLPPAPAAGAGPGLACPSCAGPVPLGTFRGEAFGACSSCAVLWLDAAPLAWATARAEAPAPPRPAPLVAAPPSRRLALGGVAAALAVALAAAGLAVARWREPAAAAAPAPAAPAVRAPAPLPAGPVEPARELFGGRTPQWWQQRLEQLSARADPEGRELWEWTLGRARANGLQVAEEGGRVRVAEPGPAPGAAP